MPAQNRCFSRILFLSVLLPFSAGGDEPKPWFEKLSLRGYTQVRYNRLIEDGTGLSDNQGFTLRRARLVLSGEVHERVSIYIQPDFASSASSTERHFAQLRDAYFDFFLTPQKELRIRLGQSKLPFGWENMQSSGNRAAFDRSDALNSAVPTERDIGAFIYFTPPSIRQRFKDLANADLKGTGDYGVLGIGAYNGQTANRPELNNNRHLVARATYPFEIFGGQILEPSLQAYSGLYTLTGGTAGVGGATTLRDRRVAATLVFYPQPIGFQIEAITGKGPEYNEATNTVEVQDQSGGYAQLMVRVPGLGDQSLMPYVRAQYFDGGRKTESDAQHSLVTQYDVGVEWRPFPAFELTVEFTRSDRRNSDGASPREEVDGNRLGLQAQFNY